MKNLILKDEFNTGYVTLWSPVNLLTNKTVPDGTKCKLISNQLNGYLLVKIEQDIWEVFQSNIKTGGNSNLN